MVLMFCKCGKGIVSGGICPACGTNRNNKTRTKTTKQAGRGHDWRTLSERYRAHHPLCVDCLGDGVVTPAQEVHHIQPIEIAPELRLDWDNLVSLCKKCHRKRHNDSSVLQFKQN
jgi:5-methylcytosine-specific restriction enzyme A